MASYWYYFGALSFKNKWILEILIDNSNYYISKKKLSTYAIIRKTIKEPLKPLYVITLYANMKKITLNNA